jgi:O-antigen ligase
VPVLSVGAAVYWILLGGTEAGVIVSGIRILNAAIAGVFIVWWLRRLPEESDLIDRLALLALLGFLAAGLLGAYPRQALDACTAAMAWTAAFYTARRLAASERNIEFALDVLGAAGLALSLLFGFLWAATWLRWSEITGFTSWPPLTVDLPELVFHHVSVVAFAVLMLLPAVLRLWRRTLLRPMVVLGVSATAFVVIAAGSRTAWLAAVLAAALTVGTRLRRKVPIPRLGRREAVVGVIGILGFATVLLALGAGMPIFQRLGTLGTIASRNQTWLSALHLWWQDPASGAGPGSFVAALPTSGYFQLNAFAPRHADNAVIQLLAEGGIIAALPLALAVGVVVGRVLRERRSWAATWAIGMFAFSSLTNNPTHMAGLNALLVVWLAIALPSRRGPEHSPPRSRLVRRLCAVGLSVVGVAYLATSVAQVAYDAALARAEAHELNASRAALTMATMLDPGVALYQRELGLVALAMGDQEEALTRLSRAVEELPTDVVSMRALAIAEQRAGRLEQAIETARRAAALRPALTASPLLAATLEDAAGRAGAASSFLVAAIGIDPLLPAAWSWSTAVGSANPMAELVARAARSAASGPATNLPLFWYDQYLLASMAGTRNPTLGINTVPGAWNLLLDCRLSEASTSVITAQAAEGGSEDYWTVRAVIASATGSDSVGLRLASLSSVGVGRLLVASPGGMSPAFDPAQDRALYGRGALVELPGFTLFPTHAEAVSAWLREPFAAVDRAAPASRLARCE